MSNKNVFSTYYSNQYQHLGNGQDLTVFFCVPLLPSERERQVSWNPWSYKGISALLKDTFTWLILTQTGDKT